MKRKIGILTQPLVSNYGGVLQNYALQHVLLNHGFEVETINRVCGNSDFKIFLQKIKQIVFKHHENKLLYNNQSDLVNYEVKQFISEYLKVISVKNPTDYKLSKIVSEGGYDSIIVGSDQVWRPRYAINIFHDYLSFLSNEKVQKIAYAASFGTSEWEYTEQEENICRELIKTFDALSVREDQAINLCKQHFNVDVKHVLDPTLLLNKNDYLKLINMKDIKKRKGVFNYVLDYDDSKQEAISFIAKAFDLDVFSNHPKFSLCDNKNIPFVIDDFRFPSIEGWLAGFRDADYIVTDSFHGTVFSIIFNKPFVTLTNTGRGSTRFTSLLKVLGLESRLIDSYEDLTLDLLSAEINYEKVNLKISELKQYSLDFLISNLKK